MRKQLFTSLVIVFLTAGFAFSQTAAPKAGVQVVGMTPYTLTQDFGSKGSSMYATTGLNTVGEKTIVYLQAIDSTGGKIQSVSWSVQDPIGGGAVIDSASAPFTTITVDTTGQYTINLTVTTAGGTSSASTVITSADYVGVGDMGIVSNDSVATDSTGQPIAPSVVPECGTCHQGPMVGFGFSATAAYSNWEQTEHASMFKNGVNGLVSSHYSSSCMKCHTTGYNPNAANGNFAVVASQAGWTFPKTLVDSNFAHVYHTSPQLAQLGTIGCESCHGAGSEHWGDITKISVSLNASVCMQCHDSPLNEIEGRMWTNSPHDSGISAIQAEEATVNSGKSTCARCHNGAGFVDYASGNALQSTYGAIPLTCAGCHDPHDASKPYQLRKVTADTLENGFTVSGGGVGQLCMNCHRSRTPVNTGVAAGYSSHFGPHEGPQTDMFWGQDGYQFGNNAITGLTTHTQLTDACVTCHMVSDTLDKKATNLLGGHTWKMSGPDSTGTQVDNTTACRSCHGPITNFDQIPAPADYAGIANGGPTPGVQTEVTALLAKVASILPDSLVNGNISSSGAAKLTQDQLGAYWDYLLVSKDGSLGVHNAKYTFALLEAAIGQITGVKVLSTQAPRSYALEQNYPNPFNPTTTINFSVAKTGIVNVSVYNEIGQLVKVLANDNYIPGTYQVIWNGRNNAGITVASGVYFYRFTAKDYVNTMKMVFLK
ncbi:MAG: T9SS type A sorting domain-containing protein [Candidatus Kryptoniota bacterium]